MELTKLKGEKRTAAGSRAAARLRKSGWVPGIIYGHGEEPVPLAMPRRELETVLQQGAHLLEVDVGGKAEQVLIKDVQFDYLGIEPLHIDFARVRLDERVRVSVPIELRGEPKGVKEGGLLDNPVVDMEIECLVTEIPEVIRVNVADLGIGDSIHLRDVPLPEGMKAAGAPDVVICTVRPPIAATAEEAAAPAEGEQAEPEIIGRKKEAEPEEEEQKK